MPIAEAESGVRAWCLPLILAALTFLAMLGVTLAPGQSGPVALVFPPWWSEAQVAEGASRAGRLIRLGGLHFIVVVQPDATQAGPDRSNGAWLTLNPRLFGACSAAAARR